MNKKANPHSHESTQSELVNELRKLVSTVRTADFDERISQGKPLTDLIQQIREIRETFPLIRSTERECRQV